MSGDNVIIVHLRRPRSKKSDPHESRSDPFWEYGSFGITTCHSKNLMNPRNADNIRGARLAFAQGGNDGTRLVYLTPPVKIVNHGYNLEAKWSPVEMPFRYKDAPILVCDRAKSHFPLLEQSINAVERATTEARFASRFRSRKTPIEKPLAKEVIRVYTRRRSQAKDSALASCYVYALPWDPPTIDRDRRQTYKQKLGEARASKRGSPKRPVSQACKNPKSQVC